jgi:hypothetical protein
MKPTCQNALKAPYSTESNRRPGTGPEFLGSDAKKVFVMSSCGEIGSTFAWGKDSKFKRESCVTTRE